MEEIDRSSIQYSSDSIHVAIIKLPGKEAISVESDSCRIRILYTVEHISSLHLH